MDPHKVVARYAVYIKENATMVEHLPFVRDGRSAKVILYFLRAERLKQNEQLQSSRKEVIFDKDEGMQMFFPLEISDQKKKLGIFNKNF